MTDDSSETEDPTVDSSSHSGGFETLLDWFEANGKKYPWSDSKDAWQIWVSEVMLQQTTVGAVKKRFSRWFDRFPDIESLALATEEEILCEWEGLGYYNRVRNLASSARELASRYGSKIPGSSKELRTFPGVGSYVAAAVASLAFGERVAAIDANVRRIAQRLWGRELWSRELELELCTKMEEEMPENVPGRLNVALMQLGQLICTPRSPKCGICPLFRTCRARRYSLQDRIPCSGRQAIIKKSTNLAILIYKGKTFLMCRESGIGRGLWMFPPGDQLGAMLAEWEELEVLEEQVHSYTHFRDRLIPILYKPVNPGVLANGLLAALEEMGEWVNEERLAAKPMPSAYRRVAERVVEHL